MPKCRYCGKELSFQEAEVIERIGHNDYYCPEHKGLVNIDHKLLKLIYQIIDEKQLERNLSRLFTPVFNAHTKEKAYSFLAANKDYYIEKFQEKINNRDFYNKEAKVKYLIAILNGELPHYTIPEDTALPWNDEEYVQHEIPLPKRESNQDKLDRLFKKLGKTGKGR